MPVLCLESSLPLGWSQGFGGVYKWVFGCHHPCVTPAHWCPAQSCSACGVWGPARAVLGPQAIPRLVLSSVTGGCQAGTQATVCLAPARQDFSIHSLRLHIPPSAFWVAGAFRAEEWGGKTPGTSFCHLSAPSLKLAQGLALLLGTLGKVDSASLGLALLTFRNRTHCCGEGRPERSQGAEAALRQAPASLHLLVVTSSCETSTYPAWPRSPRGDLPGDVGGNIQLSR